jgi:hypothetical protein
MQVTPEKLSVAYREEGMKKSSVYEWHKRFKFVARTWNVMKTMLITFFDMKNTVNFELIPQGQSTKLITGK